MSKEAVRVKELHPVQRTEGFKEVVLGYTKEEAIAEALRCLQCKKPACIAGCPVEIDIKKFIDQIAHEDFTGAYFTIRQKNNFASICGRVCPAEYQCRRTCVLSKGDLPFASPEAINIHYLERFAGDYGIQEELVAPREVDERLVQYRVAVVGSGPAGLCCASELARRGIKVVVFESLHKPGGVLRYGIPPFRLPQEILDYEINYLTQLGVEIIPNVIIGRTKSLDELFAEKFSAVFLGLGAGTPSFLKVKGENLSNIYSANEFLTRVNLMGAYKYPQFHTPVNIGNKVIVIGGGNTAMDAARVALRLQKMHRFAENTTVLYRRTEVEMPARRLEIEHGKEEGINFRFLVQPTEFIGDEEGFVKKIKCLQCRLGEPDSSGRRKPVIIEGSDFEIDCDLVIIAVGLRANQILTSVTPQLKLDKWGDIIVDPQTMKASIGRVYAGGDIVGGEGTVIEAMGAGKVAARAIIESLKTGKW